MSRIVRMAAGTDPFDVLRAVQRVAQNAARQLGTRLWAQQAVAPHVAATRRMPTRSADDRGLWYVKALARWAQMVAPLREPAELGELVQAPWRTVSYRSGDCDDVAAAVAAFAAIAGLFSAVAVYPTGPSSAHIVAVVGDDWFTPRGRATTAVIDETGTIEAHKSLWSIDQQGLRPFRATQGMRCLIVKE